MGCNLKDLAVSERVRLPDLAGKRVGIDAFLTAFQFLTTMRDRSPEGDGMPLRAPDGRYVAHLMGSSSAPVRCWNTALFPSTSSMALHLP